jgi:hypothetical protein
MNAIRVPPDIGALVQVRYKDHSLQRNIEPSKAAPIVREALGRLEREDPDYLYLVVDEYDEPGPLGLPIRKTTGFVILRSAIIELKVLSAEQGLDA